MGERALELLRVLGHRAREPGEIAQVERAVARRDADLRPRERQVECEGAAWEPGGTALRGSDLDRECLQVRRARRGQGERREAEVARAVGAEASVEPGLARDPVRRR